MLPLFVFAILHGSPENEDRLLSLRFGRGSQEKPHHPTTRTISVGPVSSIVLG
jgi:hypothetical protein